VLFAARPSSGGSPPHLGEHLAAEDFDAGEDVVLGHAGPAHAHGEMRDADAVLRDELVRHLRRRADRKAPGGEAAQLLLGRAAALIGNAQRALSLARNIAFVLCWIRLV
jgi:hypothetical protein